MPSKRQMEEMYRQYLIIQKIHMHSLLNLLTNLTRKMKIKNKAKSSILNIFKKRATLFSLK